jgi:hypothetical protein
MQGPVSGRISYFRDVVLSVRWAWVLPAVFAVIAIGAIGLGRPAQAWLAGLALSLIPVLFEGAYANHRAIEARLGAVSRERPLTFIDCDFTVDIQAIRQRQVLRILGWSLTFKNVGRRLLKYEVERAYMRVDDRQGRQKPPAVRDANASPLIEAVHRMEFEEPLEIGAVPADFVVGFTVHYDNVPAIGRRTLVREIRYDVSALLPITSRATVLRREEL